MIRVTALMVRLAVSSRRRRSIGSPKPDCAYRIQLDRPVFSDARGADHRPQSSFRWLRRHLGVVDWLSGLRLYYNTGQGEDRHHPQRQRLTDRSGPSLDVRFRVGNRRRRSIPAMMVGPGGSVPSSLVRDYCLIATPPFFRQLPYFHRDHQISGVMVV
jgi:hypothetical protein